MLPLALALISDDSNGPGEVPKSAALRPLCGLRFRRLHSLGGVARRHDKLRPREKRQGHPFGVHGCYGLPDQGCAMVRGAHMAPPWACLGTSLRDSRLGSDGAWGGKIRNQFEGRSQPAPFEGPVPGRLLACSAPLAQKTLGFPKNPLDATKDLVSTKRLVAHHTG